MGRPTARSTPTLGAAVLYHAGMAPVRPKISVLIFLILWVAGCATDHANRDPAGERFPAVSGDSLAGTETLLPDAIGGEPVVRSLVDSFYDHMQQDPEFKVIRDLRIWARRAR